jgi:hypothetical protein
MHADPPFSYLCLNIERMFLTGEAPYPVERTLLVTGALDVLMDSKDQGHVCIKTPQLVIPYSTPLTEPIRPRHPRPRGASTVASSEFLADFAPQYKRELDLFPEYLKKAQPFKQVPRL